MCQIDIAMQNESYEIKEKLVIVRFPSQLDTKHRSILSSLKGSLGPSIIQNHTKPSIASLP